MRLTFPQMGVLEHMMKDLLKRLDVDFLPPPKTTTRTLERALKVSPEMACLPLKVTIGNFMEAMEAGADTLLMAGGIGPCRFGYYAQVQRQVLEDAGYDFDMVVIEPPKVSILKFIAAFKKLAPHKSVRQIWREIKISFRKAQAFDQIEKAALATRAFETERGITSEVRKRALSRLDEVDHREEVEGAEAEALAMFGSIPRKPNFKPLKLGLIGEFYLLLEPFVNFDVEEFLGHQGIYLERSVYMTDWINPSKTNPVSGATHEQVKEAAQPYLEHFVGGEGVPSVGHTVIYAREGFDGILHIFPFTCMPDTIAKAILAKVSRELDIPVLSLVVDEQTGRGGVHTRLEAFIDLMEGRRKKLAPRAKKSESDSLVSGVS